MSDLQEFILLVVVPLALVAGLVILVTLIGLAVIAAAISLIPD